MKSVLDSLINFSKPMKQLKDELKAIGCDSAKSVLEIPQTDLAKRTDLEEETIAEVFKILRSEFE